MYVQLKELAVAKCDDYLHCCLYFTANSLSRVVTRMAEESFMSTGLSPSHAFLLMLVNEQGSVVQKDLARQLHLAPSTVTRFVDQLEKKGLSQRRSEGKSTHVTSTAAGKALQGPIEKAWKDLYHRYSKILGEENGIELTRIIDEAAAKMVEAEE